MNPEHFALGTGGCQCSSCAHTNEYSAKGFAAWPRGNPAGPRSSAAAYSAHVAYSRRDARKGDNGQGFKLPGLVYPVAPAPRLVLDWIAASYAWAEKQTPAEAGAARPADPGKDRQHLPATDRSAGPKGNATLYAVPKPSLAYCTVEQTAERWECSPERIYQWLRAERVPGAIKPSRDWLIPSKAKRPEALKQYAKRKVA